MKLIAHPKVRLPAALLAGAMVVSAVLAHVDPAIDGYRLPVLFVAAALLRALAVLYLSMVILRIALDGSRPAWLPDGGFWLYALLFTCSLGVAPLITFLSGSNFIAVRLVGELAAMAIVSVFAPWIVAVSVAEPLAWNPRPWLRDFGRWLPHRIGWGLLLVPLALAPTLLADVTGSLPWPVAVGGGVIGFAFVAIRLGLDASAYRRVAQG